MTIEAELAVLSTAATNLMTAVGTQQTSVTAAVAGFATTTTRVNALNLVDNTADLNKPVSAAAQTALNAKQALLVSGTNIATVNGQPLTDGGNIVVPRSATALNMVSYDNRGTLRSTTPQADDSSVVEGLGLFMWVITKNEPDDDETCFSTATGQWLLQIPAQDLIDAWNSYDASVTDDWREDEPTRMAAYILANK